MKKYILLLIIPLFMSAQPECMIIQSTSETTMNGVSTVNSTYYSWNNLTSSWNISDDSSNGYNIYNTNGNIVESFVENEVSTVLTNYEYDSEDRIIEVSTESSMANNTYIINYNWDGWTATISYSGDLTYEGYQTVNSNGNLIEYFMDYGGGYTTLTNYEYNSENRIILMSSESSLNSDVTIVNYNWNGLTATISYSGDLAYEGYQTVNSDEYVTEYFMDYGSGYTTLTNYEYDCNNSSLIEINNSKKLLLNIDLLGKEINSKANIPFIEIYDDGSVKKKYVIE